jgi:Flp pilus assembly protein TadD
MRFAPANANAHTGLGMLQMQMGDYGNAAAQFSDALRINPSDAEARREFNLAKSKIKRK